MSELKQELLEAVNFNEMVEESTKIVAMYYRGMEEEQAEEISNHILEHLETQELFYNTVVSCLGSEEDLAKFIEYHYAMVEASDSFIFRLNQHIVDEVNKHLPEDQKLIAEKAH